MRPAVVLVLATAALACRVPTAERLSRPSPTVVPPRGAPPLTLDGLVQREPRLLPYPAVAPLPPPPREVPRRRPAVVARATVARPWVVTPVLGQADHAASRREFAQAIAAYDQYLAAPAPR